MDAPCFSVLGGPRDHMRLFAGCELGSFHEAISILHRCARPMLRDLSWPFFVFSASLPVTPPRRYHRSARRHSCRCHHPFCLSDFRFKCRSLSYQTRRAGPFPLMILLGHTFGSIGAKSIVSEAEAFATDLCLPVWPFRFQGLAQQRCSRGWIQEYLKRGLGRDFSIKNLSWIDPKQLYLRFLPWRVLHLAASSN